ncbi:hypothetical protein [Nostoc sp. FACHB-888]|uniref:hypothetical protein n=1 Tax=Nostoc sp. FACHB-888 TaxID=2692842 RepID=UPI001686D3DD|nr:hypothetical protein [Nostoc sp. FACHB-888]MBD2245919.1 hypothetical protein [Nostoc sp. FACHB-888]MBW4452718.1 hypothetical protein [Nostoc indistinguendum CM1-VF10]MCC5649916.1 hypothetical protein [Nostoc sp. XA013]
MAKSGYQRVKEWRDHNSKGEQLPFLDIQKNRSHSPICYHHELTAVNPCLRTNAR